MNDIPEEKYLPEFQFDFNVLLLQFISKSEREGYKYHCCRGLIYSISYMVVTSPWILSIIQFNPWKQDIWQLLGIMLPFFNIVIGWAAWKKVTGVSSYKDMLSVRHCIDNRNDSILPNILWRMRGELSLNVHTLDSFLPTSCICEADSCGHVHLVVASVVGFDNAAIYTPFMAMYVIFLVVSYIVEVAALKKYKAERLSGKISIEVEGEDQRGTRGTHSFPQPQGGSFHFLVVNSDECKVPRRPRMDLFDDSFHRFEAEGDDDDEHDRENDGWGSHEGNGGIREKKTEEQRLEDLGADRMIGQWGIASTAFVPTPKPIAKGPRPALGRPASSPTSIAERMRAARAPETIEANIRHSMNPNLRPTRGAGARDDDEEALVIPEFIVVKTKACGASTPAPTSASPPALVPAPRTTSSSTWAASSPNGLWPDCDDSVSDLTDFSL